MRNIKTANKIRNGSGSDRGNIISLQIREFVVIGYAGINSNGSSEGASACSLHLDVFVDCRRCRIGSAQRPQAAVCRRGVRIGIFKHDIIAASDNQFLVWRVVCAVAVDIGGRKIKTFCFENTVGAGGNNCNHRIISVFFRIIGRNSAFTGKALLGSPSAIGIINHRAGIPDTIPVSTAPGVVLTGADRVGKPAAAIGSGNRSGAHSTSWVVPFYRFNKAVSRASTACLAVSVIVVHGCSQKRELGSDLHLRIRHGATIDFDHCRHRAPHHTYGDSPQYANYGYRAEQREENIPSFF